MPPAAVAQRVLQRAEIGVALRVGHRDLAVEQRAVAGQFRQRPAPAARNCSVQSRPLRVYITTLPPASDGDHAIAVILDLVQPLVAGRRLVDQGCELRLDEAGKRCAPAVFF